MQPFFLPDGDHFRPTPWTRGPWDARFQHGGPPSALLAGHLERWGDGSFVLSRLTVELLRPVPIDARLRVVVQPERLGRTVQRLRAELWDGETLLVEARALRIRQAELVLPRPPPQPEPWPDPETLPPYTFTFFGHEVGYDKAVELRLAHGTWGDTPIAFWGRPRVPLVQGRDSSPLERLVILVDAQSGMGVPVSPFDYAFPNPDLTVYLQRPPQGAWIGFEIRSGASTLGTGLSESALRDPHGLVGRSAQCLVVSQRPTSTAQPR